MKSLVIAAVGGCLLYAAGLDAASASSYSDAVKKYCREDYKKYCGEYGLETNALRSCMDRHGDQLSKACVRALVQSGEVSQQEVDRRKKSR